MKKFSYIFALWLLSSSALALDDAVNTGRFSATAIDGYDPVAYFTEGAAVEGSDDHVYRWRDGNWHFASRANLDEFAANPEKYAPQYGGWCAYAMSDKGRTVRIDPEAWVIHDNKLYLNYSKKVQNVWLEDRDSNIREADGYYPQTTDVTTWQSREGG